MSARKILGWLIAILFVHSGFAQENPYDKKMGEAISASKWFEVRDRYERTADSLSDFMRLFSGALLDNYFNEPKGTVEKIQQLYDRHNDRLGGNIFPLFWMMTDNLAKLGLCQRAYEICTSLLAQGRKYMDDDTRMAYETSAVILGWRSQWPPMRVVNKKERYCIPFVLEEEQIRFSACTDTKPVKAMLDTGGQMTVIDSRLAHELNLPVSADSIWFNETRCPVAILDTLRLGPATFVHIPCAVLSPINAGATECSIILGNDVLQLFPMVELDYEDRNLRLYSEAVTRPHAPRNLIMNKIPYIRVELEGMPAVVVWDTGGTKSSIEPEFYESYRDRLPSLQAHGRKQAKTITGYNPVLDYAVLPQVSVTIAGKTGVVRNPYVIQDMPHKNLTGIPFDGTLGAIPPEEFSRLTIDFQQMCFIAE